MTPKNPVYWRTSDGRKVVIVERSPITRIMKCFQVNTGEWSSEHKDQLTPWVEPKTHVSWIQLWNDESIGAGNKVGKNDPLFKDLFAQKRIEITEGEFDD